MTLHAATAGITFWERYCRAVRERDMARGRYGARFVRMMRGRTYKRDCVGRDLWRVRCGIICNGVVGGLEREIALGRDGVGLGLWVGWCRR